MFQPHSTSTDHHQGVCLYLVKVTLTRYILPDDDLLRLKHVEVFLCILTLKLAF